MSNKNKEKFFISLVLVLSIIVPQISLASAISLRSASSTIEPNKTFTLSVFVDPKAVASYTAQANIKFPADLISVESFTYTTAWMPLTQAGLDVIDNTSGKLIKTAGYPNGFNKETLLGTAVIKSKKAGAVVISTEKESYVLDIDSSNTLTSHGSFSITASAPIVTPPPVKTTSTITKNPDTKTPVTKETPAIVKTPVAEKTEVQKPIVSTEEAGIIQSIEKQKKSSLFLFLGIIIGAISAYFGFN